MQCRHINILHVDIRAPQLPNVFSITHEEFAQTSEIETTKYVSRVAYNTNKYFRLRSSSKEEG